MPQSHDTSVRLCDEPVSPALHGDLDLDGPSPGLPYEHECLRLKADGDRAIERNNASSDAERPVARPDKGDLLRAIKKTHVFRCCSRALTLGVRLFTATARTTTHQTACVTHPSPLAVGAFQNVHVVHLTASASVQSVLLVTWESTSDERTFSAAHIKHDSSSHTTRFACVVLHGKYIRSLRKNHRRHSGRPTSLLTSTAHPTTSPCHDTCPRQRNSAVIQAMSRSRRRAVLRLLSPHTLCQQDKVITVAQAQVSGPPLEPVLAINTRSQLRSFFPT